MAVRSGGLDLGLTRSIGLVKKNKRRRMKKEILDEKIELLWKKYNGGSIEKFCSANSSGFPAGFMTTFVKYFVSSRATIENYNPAVTAAPHAAKVVKPKKNAKAKKKTRAITNPPRIEAIESTLDFAQRLMYRLSKNFFTFEQDNIEASYMAYFKKQIKEESKKL